MNSPICVCVERRSCPRPPPTAAVRLLTRTLSQVAVRLLIERGARTLVYFWICACHRTPKHWYLNLVPSRFACVNAPQKPRQNQSRRLHRTSMHGIHRKLVDFGECTLYSSYPLQMRVDGMGCFKLMSIRTYAQSSSQQL